MESPQMYDSNAQPMVQVELKKITMAANNNNNNTTNNNNNNNNNNSTPNNNNNNNSVTINQNILAAKQHQQLQQAVANNNNNNNNVTNNNNLILQKHILQQYTQSDLEELTSQEISLDLQHLIDDQFRAEQESLGIFTEMVAANNGNINSATGKSLNLPPAGNNRSQQSFPRTTLPYMPQPVHTGATYTNSSDDNSSVGSDVASSIKEEPQEPIEFRRHMLGNSGPFVNGNGNSAGNNTGLYPIPPNYASNGSGNTFTTLTPSTVLHHQGLTHLQSSHLSGLKNKQMMSHRKHSHKNVDKGTDEYRRRRERNNIAVRKSREKAKVRSREVEEKVKLLIKERDVLRQRLEEMNNEIQLHKTLYVHLINHSNPEINQICRNVYNLVNINDHGM